MDLYDLIECVIVVQVVLVFVRLLPEVARLLNCLDLLDRLLVVFLQCLVVELRLGASGALINRELEQVLIEIVVIRSCCCLVLMVYGGRG